MRGEGTFETWAILRLLSRGIINLQAVNYEILISQLKFFRSKNVNVAKIFYIFFFFSMVFRTRRVF